MIEVHLYHQSVQAIGPPTNIFDRLCTTTPDWLQSSVLQPVNNGLGGSDVVREASEDVEQGQVEAVQGYLAKTRWPTRNRVIFLLSVKAGLRAKEIASLTWRMVTDARSQIGQAIHLENTA